MKFNWLNILIGVLLITAVWLIGGIFMYETFNDDKGPVGDMFGATNSLFSGLALFGIIVSILIQQKELNLQRQELAETREEFKINRLTNILYKQIDQLNYDIKEFDFYDVDDKGKQKPGEWLSFNEFNEKIESLRSMSIEETKTKIDALTSCNNAKFMKIVQIVADGFKRFKNILDSNDLASEEERKLKNLFYENLETEFKNFIEFISLNVKRPNYDNTEKPKPMYKWYQKFQDDIKGIRSFEYNYKQE